MINYTYPKNFFSLKENSISINLSNLEKFADAEIYMEELKFEEGTSNSTKSIKSNFIKEYNDGKTYEKQIYNYIMKYKIREDPWIFKNLQMIRTNKKFYNDVDLAYDENDFNIPNNKFENIYTIFTSDSYDRFSKGVVISEIIRSIGIKDKDIELILEEYSQLYKNSDNSFKNIFKNKKELKIFIGKIIDIFMETDDKKSYEDLHELLFEMVSQVIDKKDEIQEELNSKNIEIKLGTKNFHSHLFYYIFDNIFIIINFFESFNKLIAGKFSLEKFKNVSVKKIVYYINKQDKNRYKNVFNSKIISESINKTCKILKCSFEIIWVPSKKTESVQITESSGLSNRDIPQSKSDLTPTESLLKNIQNVEENVEKVPTLNQESFKKIETNKSIKKRRFHSKTLNDEKKTERNFKSKVNTFMENMEKFQENMEKFQENMEKSQENMEKSQEKMQKSIDDLNKYVKYGIILSFFYFLLFTVLLFRLK